jgi:hypothetical protein
MTHSPIIVGDDVRRIDTPHQILATPARPKGDASLPPPCAFRADHEDFATLAMTVSEQVCNGCPKIKTAQSSTVDNSPLKKRVCPRTLSQILSLLGDDRKG